MSGLSLRNKTKGMNDIYFTIPIYYSIFLLFCQGKNTL